MHITPTQFAQLAKALTTERKRQGMTRSQTAAVCRVRPSSLRDAGSHRERCWLVGWGWRGGGVAVTLDIGGWSEPPTHSAQGESA